MIHPFTAFFKYNFLYKMCGVVTKYIHVFQLASVCMKCDPFFIFENKFIHTIIYQHISV